MGEVPDWLNTCSRWDQWRFRFGMAVIRWCDRRLKRLGDNAFGASSLDDVAKARAWDALANRVKWPPAGFYAKSSDMARNERVQNAMKSLLVAARRDLGLPEETE